MNNALLNRDCPPLMSDGRFATDWRPSCTANHVINTRYGLKNSRQERKFLQRNGAKVIGMHRADFERRGSCPSAKMYYMDPFNHDQYWYNYKKGISVRY
jgi:hypothetical protein